MLAKNQTAARSRHRLQVSPPCAPSTRSASACSPATSTASPLPTPDLVAPITRAAVRKFHKKMVTPNAALIVLVGDLPPAKMVAAVDKALGGWTGTRRVAKTPAPAPVAPGPFRIVHQPGRRADQHASRADRRRPLASGLSRADAGAHDSRRRIHVAPEPQPARGQGLHVRRQRQHVPQLVGVTQITVGADVQTAVTAPGDGRDDLRDRSHGHAAGERRGTGRGQAVPRRLARVVGANARRAWPATSRCSPSPAST